MVVALECQDILIHSQVLSPTMRKQWQHIADARNWTSKACVQDAQPLIESNTMDGVRNRAAQPWDTKCAVCREMLPPDKCVSILYSDFTEFCKSLSNRKTAGPSLALGWSVPNWYPLGFTIFTRATLCADGPAFMVCKHCKEHPLRKHFQVPEIPLTVLTDENGHWHPPTHADLGYLNPVRCHDRLTLSLPVV